METKLPSRMSSTTPLPALKPSPVTDPHYPIKAVILTGKDRMCYPNEDGAETYTHVELCLHDSKNRHVDPNAVPGLEWALPYFAGPTACFLAIEIADKIKDALDRLSPKN